jgi:hypothetical protein
MVPALAAHRALRPQGRKGPALVGLQIAYVEQQLQFVQLRG